MQTRHAHTSLSLKELITKHTQPCWKFWHPGSGVVGGLITSVLLLVIVPALWRTFFK